MESWRTSDTAVIASAAKQSSGAAGAICGISILATPGLGRFAALAVTGWAAPPGLDRVATLAVTGWGNEGRQVVKQPAVYIMANRRNGTLYTGVTSNLIQRVYQHKEGLTGSCTAKYGCTLLVYHESFDEMAYAIAREKQIKGGARKKKLALIESMNPMWRDLYPDLM